MLRETIKTIIIFLFINTSLNAQNGWSVKSPFGGSSRYNSVGFSINGKGYAGTGSDSLNATLTDLYEYDPITDSWTQKASLIGPGVTTAVAFSIGNKGYLGTGALNGFINGCPTTKNFYEYDPNTNQWTQKADYLGDPINNGFGFAINGKGYIGSGNANSCGGIKSDFYEYDPTNNTWSQKANIPALGGVYKGVAFTIGSKGYVGTGGNQNPYLFSLWEYDPTTNTWTQKADYPGKAPLNATGFAINGYGYIGT